MELIQWLIFTSLSILGIYTIYHYAFTLAWHFCYIFLALFITGKLRRKDLTKLIAASLLIILSYMPWISNLMHHLKITAGNFYFGSHIPLENWPNKLLLLFNSFIFGYHTEHLEAANFGLKIIAVITTIFFFKAITPRLKKNRTESAFWFSTIFLPLSIIAADFWHDTHTFFILRTSIALLPLLVIAVVTGAFEMDRIFFRWILLALWFSILLLTSMVNITSHETRGSERQGLVNYVLKHDRPSHVVVFNDQERGYLMPVLVSLRDGGVERIRVTIAGRKELFETISKLSRDSSVLHISLINLEIKYDKNVVWTEADVEKANKVVKLVGKKFKSFKLAGQYI